MESLRRMGKDESLIPVERIESRILLIRGQKVLLDSDLAELYGVETRRLNEQVKRNIERFPSDFMFQLDHKEFAVLISQIATSSSGHGGVRKMPYVFTEHGAIQAANVLSSAKAVQMGIFVVRAFIKMREMLLNNAKLAAKLKELEERMDTQEMNTIIVLDKLRQIEGETKKAIKDKASRKIGFPAK